MTPSVPGWLLACLLLAACGSTPPADERPAPQAAGAAELPAEEAEPIPPLAAQRFDSALALAEAGDSAAAESAFRTLADEYPGYSGPLVNLAILHVKAGRLQDAEAALQQAIERNPRNAVAFNQLGIVYRNLGRFSEADEAYQHALRLDPEYANAYLNLGVLCDLYLQQPKRALDAFERYLQLVPDEKVSGWVRELRTRVDVGQRTARVQP